MQMTTISFGIMLEHLHLNSFCTICHSDRTDKQSTRHMMLQGRAPPIFKRTPSRRQPRRCIDEILDNKTNIQKRAIGKHEIKSISIPQPAQA